MRNPFYDPDGHNIDSETAKESTQITNRSFIREVERIGQAWRLGVTAI